MSLKGIAVRHFTRASPGYSLLLGIQQLLIEGAEQAGGGSISDIGLIGLWLAGGDVLCKEHKINP